MPTNAPLAETDADPRDENAELFLPPGDGHLFADSSLNSLDQEAAALLEELTLALLEPSDSGRATPSVWLTAGSRSRIIGA
jgi:hypothetical protein